MIQVTPRYGAPYYMRCKAVVGELVAVRYSGNTEIQWIEREDWCPDHGIMGKYEVMS